MPADFPKWCIRAAVRREGFAEVGWEAGVWVSAQPGRGAEVGLLRMPGRL